MASWASGVSGAQAGADETEESALSVAQSGTHGWVDSAPPPGVPGSVGIGVGTEGAAAAKDERAGASIGEAGEGVGVMGASEASAAGAASPPVKEAPEKSGTSETTGAAGAAGAAGGS